MKRFKIDVLVNDNKDFFLLSNQITHITMYGKNSSMNVVQATSIALYQISNQLNEM